jgi:hypothetical protein
MIASSTIRKCFAEIIQERNGAHEMVGSQELVPKRWCSIYNCSPPSTESKKRATIHATWNKLQVLWSCLLKILEEEKTLFRV